MRRILIINTSGLGVGGITTHMLNYIDALKQIGYEGSFTIVVTGIRDEQVLKKFVDLECTLEYFPDRKRHLLRYIASLNSLISNQQFDVIHVHGNSSTMGLELLFGKMKGIPVRIAHCHNSKCKHAGLHKLIYPLFGSSYTSAVACSKLAGDWIFGSGNYVILSNAINLQQFQYSTEIRKKYRGLLKIPEDTLLVGHVGNFNEQKNHEFLISVFFEILKQRKAKLILIGDGLLQENIKNLARKLQINNNVCFLGIRDDVNCWMQAMDVFVFPSRWEGLGMVAIEAQATGLPVLASTEVPREACLTPYMKFVSLEQNAQFWANSVLEISALNKNRNVVREMFSKYDISCESKKIQELYEN